MSHKQRALVGLIVLAAALAANATDYVVLIQDQPAGHLKVQTGTDGRTETDLSYRDNGRGPDVRESFRVDARGVPVAYEANGRSTFGAAIRESYQRDGNRARWTSPADQGDLSVPDDFVFIPLEASAGYYDAVLRLLLSRPDASAPTVGGLRLQAERALRLTLATPSGPLPLALAVVTGADAEPWYYWVRDDGTNAFFALTWPGWATVEKGFEAQVAELTERQRQAVDARLAVLRQRLAQPLEGLTLIRAVRWFDAPAARMRGPADVWLFDGRIGAVVAPGTLKVRPDRVVEGSGRTLLPGLWDMHAHMWPSVGLMHLAAGVTSVRDPANQNADILRLQARIARGEVAGPAIHIAGFIEGKSAFSSRNGFVVDTLQAGLDAVDWYAARGFRSIKLYNSIKPEWVRPLAARAKAQGLRVSGHIPAFMLAEAAVRDGYDEITHINQVMLNFVTRPGDDPRTLMRFERVGSDGQALDLKSAKARAFIALLRQRGTTVDPTLGAFEAMFTQAQGQPNPSAVDIAEHLPVLWQRGLRSAEMDLAGSKLKTFRQSYQRMLDMTLALHRAGVPLVAGTDAMAGLGLHRELALYVQAGIPAPEALRIGTWNGAKVAGEGATRGRIERGYAADLVLVDGDPSVNIADLHRASLVIQGRTAYVPAQLYETLGFKPFVAGATFAPPPP
jgi:hypothetical protein